MSCGLIVRLALAGTQLILTCRVPGCLGSTTPALHLLQD